MRRLYDAARLRLYDVATRYFALIMPPSTIINSLIICERKRYRPRHADF